MSESNPNAVAVETQAVTAPPNPFYRREYATPVAGGQAWLSMPAPGNKITAESARDLIEWLGLIVSQLNRIAESEANHA